VGAQVVAYDSTYLPSGFLSAGGAIHAEDLLQVAARLVGDRPVIVLLHHHLIPTPVTDVSRIDASGEQLYFQLLVKHALPWVISHGESEELSMTAFGAGTALSMLHALGRAVIVLHGHKHYPTARVLHGTRAGEGDIVVTSAGSAGTTQIYEPTSPEESVQLWPSFNTVELSPRRLDVSTTFWATCEGADIKLVSGARFPSLRLQPGRATGYRLRGGLCRSLTGAARLYAAAETTPFEWVGLLVRHRSQRARLVLSGLPQASVAFGSATDLHTGRQRPLGVRVEDGRVILEEAPCQARQLLRIHWPLERG
jgi:hypothetical protein